jgi:hypothetical protein
MQTAVAAARNLTTAFSWRSCPAYTLVHLAVPVGCQQGAYLEPKNKHLNFMQLLCNATSVQYLL